MNIYIFTVKKQSYAYSGEIKLGPGVTLNRREDRTELLGSFPFQKRGAYRELEQQMYSEHTQFCLGSFLPLPIKFEMQLNHGSVLTLAYL